MVGIDLVNDVPKARASHGAAREEKAQLQKDLKAAKTVIVENKIQIMAMASMFDLIAESNPMLGQVWREIRPTIHCDHTPEEQAELERQTEHRSSELRDNHKI